MVLMYNGIENGVLTTKAERDKKQKANIQKLLSRFPVIDNRKKEV